MKLYNMETTENKRMAVLFTISLFVIALLVILLFFLEHQRNKITVLESEPRAVNLASTQISPTVKLEAKAAYVLDITTGNVLYAQNEEAQLPLASLTKLMTAIVASEYLKADESIAISDSDLLVEGNSGLVSGERWTVRDLLSFTLVVSANDGALALARAAGEKIEEEAETKALVQKSSVDQFITHMNEKATVLGLAQTYFLNPTGLDSTEYTSGGYGSAHDVATLLMYAIKNNLSVTESTRRPESAYLSDGGLDEHHAINTNQIIDKIPGLMASKTGFTDLAGGNLVIAFDAGINHPIVIAVLGSSIEGRFSDVDTLIQETLKVIALQ